MNRWLKKENKAWLQNKGLLTIGDAKELKARVKDYVDNIVTLAAGQVCAEQGLDALDVPLVLDDAETSVQQENV